jgi:hypothetical protein
MYRVFAKQGIAFASGTLTLQTVPPQRELLPLRSADVLPLPARQPDEPAAIINRPAAAQTQLA